MTEPKVNYLEAEWEDKSASTSFCRRRQNGGSQHLSRRQQTRQQMMFIIDWKLQ